MWFIPLTEEDPGFDEAVKVFNMRFDADALLAALPRRQIGAVHGPFRMVLIEPRVSSALGQPGEYNGFTSTERNRTARLSKRLIQLGATQRSQTCDICESRAEDEHAEDYYDLSRWIGLCRSCHRNALHKRFANPARWLALLDSHELPETHWARLVSPDPFDLADLLRSRGSRESVISDFGNQL